MQRWPMLSNIVENVNEFLMLRATRNVGRYFVGGPFLIR